MVIPALNRDGDCLSDLVLAMFGSIAGAESVLMALDENLHPKVAMAEAPHGTAPTLQGKNVANPMAMLLAQAALLDQAAQHLDDPASRWRANDFATRRSKVPPRACARSTWAARRPRAAWWTTSSRGCAPRSSSGAQSQFDGGHHADGDHQGSHDAR